MAARSGKRTVTRPFSMRLIFPFVQSRASAASDVVRLEVSRNFLSASPSWRPKTVEGFAVSFFATGMLQALARAADPENSANSNG